MRYQVTKKHSTRAERIFAEVCKDTHIKFKHRWILNGREIDFVIGRLAIEIDGHEQNQLKNLDLIEMGYVPIHFSNQEIIKNRETIKKELLKYVYFN